MTKVNIVNESNGNISRKMNLSEAKKKLANCKDKSKYTIVSFKNGNIYRK